MATNNSALYGINRGEAQVFDTSGIDNAFQQLLARKQQQRQQEIKQLTDQQAQLRPEGLRNDAERQKYFNGVNDWRNLSIQAQNEKNPYQKSLLKSKADQAYLGLQSFVSSAKQAAKNEDAFGQMLLNPTIRDRYTPDVVNKYLANRNLSHDDPNYVKDFNTYEQQVDHSKVLDRIDKANKLLLDQAKWGTPVLQNTKVGNRNATFINNSRAVSPEAQADKYGQMYEADREFKKMLMDIHPEIYNDPNLTPQQQKAAAIGALIKNQGPIAEYKAPQEKQDQPPNMTLANHIAMRNYDIAHPLPGQSTSQYTPAQILVGGSPNGDRGMIQGNTDAMKHLVNLAPKSQYGKGNAPVVAIDPNTGNHIFRFPAQVVTDKKAVNDNKKLRAEYEQDPETKGGFLGIGAKKIPFEQSERAKQLKPEISVKKPEQTYTLDPNDPNGYFGQVSQMAKDQNISLGELNKIQGGKGGKGIIPTATNKQVAIQPQQQKTILYNVDGKQYNIPSDKVKDFLKAYPHAEHKVSDEGITFSVNGHVGTIPLNRVKEFLKEHPNAIRQ